MRYVKCDFHRVRGATLGSITEYLKRSPRGCVFFVGVCAFKFNGAANLLVSNSAIAPLVFQRVAFRLK